MVAVATFLHQFPLSKLHCKPRACLCKLETSKNFNWPPLKSSETHEISILGKPLFTKMNENFLNICLFWYKGASLGATCLHCKPEPAKEGRYPWKAGFAVSLCNALDKSVFGEQSQKKCMHACIMCCLSTLHSSANQ